jgi:hypothetical protein
VAAERGRPQDIAAAAAREVVREFIEDYLAATERLSNSLPD